MADDTVAVQRALDAASAGGTVKFAAGKVYRHSDLLIARVAGEHLTGSGTLLATNEARSSVWISADNVLLDGGLTVRMGTTTRRWSAPEQTGIRLNGVAGAVLRGVKVEGSSGGGIFIDRSSGFLIEDVSVSNTRADGVHMTAGSHDGTIRRPIVTNSGDDGVAVVSYQADGAVCNHITIDSPTIRGTAWGRGLSVVGGEDITYRNINVDSSNAAAVYIADEGAPWYTYSSKRVSVLGGLLTRSNTNSAIDHGAILLYSARPSYTVEDATIDGVTITDTRTTASRQVGVLTDGGAVTRAMLSNLTIRGGGPAFAANTIATSYNTINWTVDGSPRPDHLGW